MMKLRHIGTVMGLWGGSALAQDRSALEDVGWSFEGLPRVVIVSTPGVDRSATVYWEHQLEQSGFDVWLLSAPSEADSEQAVRDSIEHIDEIWPPGSYDLLAHGYAGRLVVDANPKARKMVLVGAPLGPQMTPTVSKVPRSGPVVEGLPWPTELLGSLPMEAVSAELAHAYLEMAQREAARDPDAEVFLVASGGDVVAPVECVRLPSKTWSDRRFWRADAFTVHPLQHGDLLHNKAVFREIQRYLEQ
ncbi:MAG: hypothetical protein VXW32_01605 [Myxococcota bacterium]|nr:hypothetical protein [Myxococcota bacterium]